MMQTSCAYLWTALLFRDTFPIMANDVYFWYVNMVEFFILIFMRTRSSLQFLPKMVTMINVIFLVYINSYMYAASMELLLVLITLTVTLFLLFLKWFEQPAMTEWNPFDQNTPSLSHPRIGYQLVLSDSNFGTGFSVWHAFMPLRPRESFTELEQAHFNELSEQNAYGIDYNPRRPRR